MRLFWLLIAVVTVNDISCDNTTNTIGTSSIPIVQCIVHNVTDISQIKSSCDNASVYLFIKETRLHLFPHVFEYFRNLHSVDLTNCGIQHIETTTFDKAAALVYLDMDGSNITTLQNSIFSHANNLTSFEIQNSSIVTIEENAFQGLSRLIKLDLSYNNILHLGPEIFKPLRQLQTLRITNNKIQVIDKELFKHNINLGFAYFSSNEIIVIDPDSFIHTKLMTLDVGYNNLTAVDLSTMKDLKMLTVNNNKLTTLIVPPTATEIQAGSNNISTINSEESNQLAQLHLSSNCLNNLQSLAHFKQLTFLDLSKNHLQNIQFSDLKNLPNLKELSLTGNRLSEINASDVKTNLPNLEFIELSTIHWPNQYLYQLEEELKHLNITISQDRTDIFDDVTTSPRPAVTTSQPTIRPVYPTEPSNGNNVEKRLEEIIRRLSDLELSKSNESANVKKIEDQLKEMNDKMNSSATSNANYDAMLSTVNSYKTMTIIMFVPFLLGSIVGLYIVFTRFSSWYGTLRYRRTRTSDLFADDHL